jgi:virginiamycin B lyase
LSKLVPARLCVLLCASYALHAGAADIASKQFPLSALPIVARVKVPVGPGWLETGFGSLWISKPNSKEVLRVDPAINRVVATIPVGSDPELGIGVGLGFVWVADTKDRTITQIDPTTNSVVKAIPVVDIGADPEGSIGVGEGGIWVMTNRRGTKSGTLTRIDPASGKVTADIAVKPQSHAAIVAFGSVWVTNSAAATVTRVDPSSNSVVAEIAVHALPRFLIANEDGIWVLSQSDGTLARIDPSTNSVVATIDVGVPGPGGDLAAGERHVWVSAQHIPLSQIDPIRNRLMRQFVGGKNDDTMRVAFGSVWVLDDDHGEIWRIDLEKLESLPAPQ